MLKPSLEDYLVGAGYHRHDAIDIVNSYNAGGLELVRLDHAYFDEMLDELIGNIEQYFTEGWGNGWSRKFLDEESKLKVNEIVRDYNSPLVYYNKAGDCIEAAIRRVSYRGQRINERITLMHDLQTDEVIGVIISDIKSLGLVPKD